MLKQVFAALAGLLLAAGAALAQSTPGFTTGQVPSAADWNSYFANKTDYPLKDAAVATSIASNVLTIDLNAGVWFSWTNNANITTLTIANRGTGVRTFFLMPVGNGSAFTQAGFSTVKWAGGVAPTVTSTSGAWDIYACSNPTATATFSCVISGQGFGP
jgi:hypothetical protein